MEKLYYYIIWGVGPALLDKRIDKETLKNEKVYELKLVKKGKKNVLSNM